MRDTEGWIAWTRLIAVPFAFAEVVIERGNYPPGYERWAWTTTGVFAVGSAALFFRRGGALALAFDSAIVSSYVCIYSFEPGSPVRQLFFLAAIEGGLRYGPRGALLVPLAAVPALWFFERQVSDRLGEPYDVGHILGPVGLQLLVGLVVGSLARRVRR